MFGLFLISYTIQNFEAWAKGFEKKIKNGFEKDLKLHNLDLFEDNLYLYLV